MNIFSNYARYYNLLYKDKNYAEEAQFIHNLIQASSPAARDILELGCGTGNHAALLADKGYRLLGIDFSDEMLQKANERVSQLPVELASRLDFAQGDIRQVRLSQTFGLVISLFHVISYQITNKDLTSLFNTVRNHLKPGGFFIFDVWYGLAVLNDPPGVRVKRLEDDKTKVYRIAESVIFASENCVDVNYQALIVDKLTNVMEEISETHRMRYLFRPEIELCLEQLNMKIVDCREWLSNQKPDFNTWSVYFIVQG
jgi:SAM-dependent methyltransferase